MRLKDNETSSFGAEALPGGLREINAARGGGESPVEDRPSAARGTPLVGLIALVARYFGCDTTRK